MHPHVESQHNAFKLAMKCKYPFNEIQKLLHVGRSSSRCTNNFGKSLFYGGGEWALLKKGTPALVAPKYVWWLLTLLNYPRHSIGSEWKWEVQGGKGGVGGGRVCCFTTFSKARKRRCCKVVANKLKWTINSCNIQFAAHYWIHFPINLANLPATPRQVHIYTPTPNVHRLDFLIRQHRRCFVQGSHQMEHDSPGYSMK